MKEKELIDGIRSFGRNALISQKSKVAPKIRKKIKVVGVKKAGITPFARI